MGLMVLIIIFMILATAGGCYVLGRRTAAHENTFLKRHPAVAKYFILGYIIFAGCFVFPLGSEPFPLDFMKLYLVVASYGIIGLGFAWVFGASGERKVYLLTLSLTICGMICRYLLEYGEASNTYNFTLFNIFSYIAAIPLVTVIAYHYIVKYLTANNG